uniref:Uncharacterized protein n=1 Tax=Candidatus Kentrum sp. LPFa TaxID=2126335 RepID=A0A450W773_9GAMM|nr:MAG: hypothetical protein BECKLPF1236A_GA0070988_100771 [Candidatus Kentron sp. LPFa]
MDGASIARKYLLLNFRHQWNDASLQVSHAVVIEILEKNTTKQFHYYQCPDLLCRIEAKLC